MEEKRWKRSEGKLNDNSRIELLPLLERSYDRAQYRTTYKYVFFKSLLCSLPFFDGDFCVDFRVLAEAFGEIYWNTVSMFSIPSIGGGVSCVEKLVRDFEERNPHIKGCPFSFVTKPIRLAFLNESEDIFTRYVIGAFYDDVDGMLFGFSKARHSLYLNEKSFRFLMENKEYLESLNRKKWMNKVEKIAHSNRKPTFQLAFGLFV